MSRESYTKDIGLARSDKLCLPFLLVTCNSLIRYYFACGAHCTVVIHQLDSTGYNVIWRNSCTNSVRTYRPTQRSTMLAGTSVAIRIGKMKFEFRTKLKS